MPLIWRYLLRIYIKVFALSLSGFIGVLLITRFQTIARFAATGAPFHYILEFILFQVPFILPLALPISCLIAALVTFQKVSRSDELTAMRTAGLSILPIAFPLLTLALFLSLANFTVASEISPKCRAHTKKLVYKMTSLNPLCLLQKETLIKLKNTYVDMKSLKSGKEAEDVIFITKSHSNQRLGLMLAKKLYLDEKTLKGEQVTFISSLDAKNPQCYDHLVIENQNEMETPAAQVTQYLKSYQWNVNYNYLPIRMLRIKNKIESPAPWTLHPKAGIELARRLSLGLAAFTFTLMGIAFGFELSRNRTWKGILFATALATFYLTAFVAGKSLKHHWIAASTSYLLPHLVIIAASLLTINRHTKGAE